GSGSPAVDSPASRRTFLKQSALVGGAWAVPAAARLARAATSANETVSIAVIGVNGRGAALADGFATVGGARVTHLCDVDERALDRAASALAGRQTEAPKRVGDLRRLFDDPAIAPAALA